MYVQQDIFVPLREQSFHCYVRLEVTKSQTFKRYYVIYVLKEHGQTKKDFKVLTVAPNAQRKWFVLSRE